MTESNYPPPVSRLLTLGEGERRRQWPDYLVLGLTLEHVPDLIRMALDDELHSAAPDSLDVWAPLHAWRALGQLQAEDAAEPLIQLLVRIDDFGDDWVNQELPQVLGMIGPSVVPLLADYLADPSTKLWASVSTTTPEGTTAKSMRSGCFDRGFIAHVPSSSGVGGAGVSSRAGDASSA